MAYATGRGQVGCRRCGLALTTTRDGHDVVYSYDFLEWERRCIHAADGSPVSCMWLHTASTGLASQVRQSEDRGEDGR